MQTKIVHNKKFDMSRYKNVKNMLLQFSITRTKVPKNIHHEYIFCPTKKFVAKFLNHLSVIGLFTHFFDQMRFLPTTEFYIRQVNTFFTQRTAE